MNLDFSPHHLPGKLILIGGVQINMPGSMPDLFEPMMFEIRELEKPTVNLLSKLLKSASTSAGSVTAAEIAREKEALTATRAVHLSSESDDARGISSVSHASKLATVPMQLPPPPERPTRRTQDKEQVTSTGYNTTSYQPSTVSTPSAALNTCLNCGVVGHRTRNCTTNVCGLCRQRGHTW